MNAISARTLWPQTGTTTASILCLAATTLFSPNAGAHHPSPTTRVAESSPPNSDPSSWHRKAQFRGQLQWQHSNFDRTLRQSTVDESSPLGRVTRKVLSLGLAATTQGGQSLSASLSAGRVQMSGTEEAAASSRSNQFDLGDLQLQASQAFSVGTGSSSLQIGAGLGALIPTGRYERQAKLQVVDLETDSQGGLEVVTRSSQASLGNGSLSMDGFAFAFYQPRDNLRLAASTALRVPLTRTPDNLLWGRDFQARASAQWRFWPDLLSLVGGLSYLHHSRDSERLDAEPQAFGGWQQLSAFAALTVEHPSGLGCQLGAEQPLWQFASTAQLMQSTSLRAGCGWSFPL